MNEAVAECLAGRISPEVALARLLLSGLPPAEIAGLLPADSALSRLFAARRGALATVADMLAEAQVDHAEARTPQAIARMFDRAVARAPEASVAAYALGDPALLARATDELVDWLVARGLAFSSAAVLDIGCGIGRVAAALTPRVGSVLGLDVSPGMIAEARRRHPAQAGLTFAVTDGGPPAMPPASLDLVLAVDSFPYLVQAGIADRQIKALTQMLRPGGALAILNLSYGAGVDADRRWIGGWADQLGLQTHENGDRPFSLWDGAAFVLSRPG